MKSKMLKRFSRLILVTFIFSAIQSVSGQDAISPDDRGALSKAFRQAQTDSGPQDGSESLFSQQAKLTAFDAANDDNFGTDVALVGDTAVIGVPRDDIGGNADQGSAYVFVRSSSGLWSFQQKLTASDGAAGDSFGASVAIANVTSPNQTVIMIGAFGDDINANPNQGSVYTFVRSSGGLSYEARISASLASRSARTATFRFRATTTAMGKRTVRSSGHRPRLGS